DGEALRVRVRRGDADVLLRGVDARDLETKPGHRLAQESAAAANIKKAQPLEGLAPLGVTPEPRQRLLADEGQPRRIEPVQRRELPPRIPPPLRQGGEPRDLCGVDAAHGSLLDPGRDEVNGSAVL